MHDPANPLRKFLLPARGSTSAADLAASIGLSRLVFHRIEAPSGIVSWPQPYQLRAYEDALRRRLMSCTRSERAGLVEEVIGDELDRLHLPLAVRATLLADDECVIAIWRAGVLRTLGDLNAGRREAA